MNISDNINNIPSQVRRDLMFILKPSCDMILIAIFSFIAL